ncbi:MAG: DUF2239 family protein [Rhodopseudomonas palustris]|uniref:DUF2239 family protein n=1 Tax=Rhodopseudomonas palustris TaxID=1076 RepID=A0A933RT81_RHOPL|nr:DUF2239 family protein [Rhodopseudomonas palustris]
MPSATNPRCVVFHGERKIAEGDLRAAAAAVKPLFDRDEPAVLVFDADTSARIEFDLRGSLDDVLARLPPEPPPAEPAAGDHAGAPTRGPGRPKLGVVAREVTLLPRHWEWLAQQRGGASVALRRLVDEARRASVDQDRVRAAQDATHRFMTVMAGDRPGYEEAARALFAGDAAKFDGCTASWPGDVRDHVRRLAQAALRTGQG